MNLTQKLSKAFLFIIFLLLMTACNVNKPIKSNSSDPISTQVLKLADFRSGGGSSGMEQIDAHSYLVVYDVKNFKEGTRIGLVKVTEEALTVYPISIDSWDDEGISSDLESICAIPNRNNEFLIAESGNWQGKLGRVFHISLDMDQHKATVLGSFKIPLLNRNDFGQKGDQYEAMLSLPDESNKIMLVLGERGGSAVNPNGIIRWGVLDLNNYSFDMSKNGLKGIQVHAPGNWMDSKDKRDITDFHVDKNGGIWATASEDQGDSGPFYSIVYKLGQVNSEDKLNPIIVFPKIQTFKEINGFKIEALSGPCKGINSTHSFGTEDEIYGGVWRPIDMVSNK